MMKKIWQTCLTLGMILMVSLSATQGFAATPGAAGAAAPAVAITPKTKDYLKNVQLFAQSTVRIQGTKTVYIDPFNIARETHDADLILITHPHEDHFSVTDIAKIKKPGTILVVPDSMIQEAKTAGVNQVTTVVPNQRYQEDGVVFKALPAYNIDKPYHPKAKEWVGYLVQLNGILYYHAGDTDLLPEMKIIKTDVAFLPVGGTYTANAAEAAQAAALIRPAVAVPMHYGSVVGSSQDALKFVQLLKPGIKGAIIQNTKPL